MNIFSILIILCFFYVTKSSAGTFEKTDEGSVSWVLRIKNGVGQISLLRMKQGTHDINLSFEERKIIMKNFNSFYDLGSLGKIEAKFNNKDESSKDEVVALIKKKMGDEISVLKEKTEIISQDLTLTNLSCVKKGFLKKTLECSAIFKSKILAEILIVSEVNNNLEINDVSRRALKEIEQFLDQNTGEASIISK